MDTIELCIPVRDAAQAEIAIALLDDYPFDGFATESGLLKAYMPADRMADCDEAVSAILRSMGITGVTRIAIEAQDWNAAWEASVTPVAIDGVCRIRAPFHAPDPAAGIDLVILPRMAFGTGHHATTCGMCAAMAARPEAFRDRTGLDVGSGTGVLAILAVKLGARHVDAVDIDPWAYDNGRENAAGNGVADRIDFHEGGIERVADRTYDFVLANINRNIILRDLTDYRRLLAPGGLLLLSGLLEADVRAVTDRATETHLAVEECTLREGWAVIRCRKPQK